jgi:methionine biosynthesis protein MetW
MHDPFSWCSSGIFLVQPEGENLSDSRKHGEKGRNAFQEVFGDMPMPGDTGKHSMDYDAYWTERIQEDVVTEPSRRRARAVLNMIGEGDSVLDVGCGTGETLEFLRSKRSIHGIGLDISTVALDSLRRKGFGAIQADLTRPETDLTGEWDHIILFEILEHVQDAEVMMEKLKGHFRKGLYVTTPNLGYIAHRLRLVFGRFPVTYILDPREHLRFWSVRDFSRWSVALGYGKPRVKGLRGKPNALGLCRHWPSLWASEVLYCFEKQPSSR